MSSIRDIIDELKAAGVEAAVILSVVEKIDGMVASVKLGPSKGAERTRRWREKRQASQNVTRDVTCDVSCDVSPSPPNGPPSPPAPPLPPLNPPAPSSPRAERGRALPDDWQPLAKHFDLGLHLGRDRRFVEQQAESMREWAGANRNRAVARKADWDLTFTGWLKREAGKGVGANRGPPRNGKPTNADLMQHFADELRAKHEPPSDRTEERRAGHGFGRDPDAGAPLFERPGLERKFTGPTLDLVAGRPDDG